MAAQTLTRDPVQQVTACLAGVDDGTTTIHAAFVAESVRLLTEATLDGRLPQRAGLSRADALVELRSLVSRALQRATA